MSSCETFRGSPSQTASDADHSLKPGTQEIHVEKDRKKKAISFWRAAKGEWVDSWTHLGVSVYVSYEDHVTGATIANIRVDG